MAVDQDQSKSDAGPHTHARAHEVNFDGLVGPTHHYAGLSRGNVASTTNAKQISNPREAALQGIKKAAFVRDLGLKQAILPPLRRPSLETLRSQGFIGDPSQILEAAYRANPGILSACYSASSMWTANAATVSPSSDTSDGRVHITPANLTTKFHRSIEARATGKNLKRIFCGDRFYHHEPMPSHFGDEGAANHGRLVSSHGETGIEVFVFGRSASSPDVYVQPKKFPARQTMEASHEIASLHGLQFSRVLISQQNPSAIDAGVFHNDVISVMNENIFFYHERAFVDQAAMFARLSSMWQSTQKGARPLELISVLEKDLPLEDVVKSYLFNSQLVSLPAGGAHEMALICPMECQTNPRVWSVIQKILATGGSIRHVHPLDLKQSMQNGGGPACLRLRVVLTAEEVQAVHPGVWLTKELEGKLVKWVEKHYRDHLEISDLRDVAFFKEVQAAMDELEKLLGLELA